MDHNLRRLPHCPKHHHSGCSGPPFLRNLPGRLCTLFGVKYILATVDSAPTLLRLCSQTEEEKVLDWALEDLVWKEGQLLPVEDFPDGIEVNFDALLKPTGQGAYQIVLVWVGPKPVTLLIPAEGTFLLLKHYKNIEIDCALAGNLFVKVNFGKNILQLETPKVVIVSGNYTDISALEINQLETMKACISVVLIKTFTGFQTKYIVSSLYFGDLPENLESPHKMTCYIEPIVGNFEVAKENATILFDVQFFGENFKHLLQTVFRNEEIGSLCSNWSHLDRCVVHLLIHNTSKQGSVCFFSDLSYCYTPTNIDVTGERVTHSDRIFKNVNSKEIVSEGVETPEVKSDVVHPELLNDPNEISSLKKENKDEMRNSEQLQDEEIRNNGSQISSDGPMITMKCETNSMVSDKIKKNVKPKKKRRIGRNKNKLSCKHSGSEASISEPTSLTANQTDSQLGSVQSNDIRPSEMESEFSDIGLETCQESDCRIPSWEYPTVLPRSHKSGYYKKTLLLAKKDLVRFATSMQHGSSTIKTLREKRGVANEKLLTSIPKQLHYLLFSMRFCQVRRLDHGTSPETVLKLICLLNGNENWLLFKVLKDTILLPVSNVISMNKALSQSMMMLTVPLEKLVFVGGYSVDRLSIAAYEEELPAYLTKNLLEDWILTGKLITQSKLDTVIGVNSAGLNTSFVAGIRVVGYLIGCKRIAEGDPPFHLLKCFPSNDHDYFYATVDSSLKFNFLSGNTLSLRDLSSIDLDTLVLCLACVRLDDRPSSMFPGYVASDITLGSESELRRLARTWKKRCSSHLMEWRK